MARRARRANKPSAFLSCGRSGAFRIVYHASVIFVRAKLSSHKLPKVEKHKYSKTCLHAASGAQILLLLLFTFTCRTLTLMAECTGKKTTGILLIKQIHIAISLCPFTFRTHTHTHRRARRSFPWWDEAFLSHHRFFAILSAAPIYPRRSHKYYAFFLRCFFVCISSRYFCVYHPFALRLASHSFFVPPSRLCLDHQDVCEGERGCGFG